jgi:hypothetical protein
MLHQDSHQQMSALASDQSHEPKETSFVYKHAVSGISFWQ